MDPFNREKEIDFETVRKLYNSLVKYTGLSAEGKEASNSLYNEVTKCIERLDATSNKRQQSLDALRTTEGHLELLKANFRQHDKDHTEAVLKAQVVENALSIVNHDLGKRRDHVQNVEKVIQNSITKLRIGLDNDAAKKRKLSATNPELPGNGSRKMARYNAYVEDDPEGY